MGKLLLWGTGAIEKDAANPKRFGTEKANIFRAQASLSKSGKGIAGILRVACPPPPKSRLIFIELMQKHQGQSAQALGDDAGEAIKIGLIRLGQSTRVLARIGGRA